MYANPPTWNFPVQACDSNYITLKQIQIIDTLVAKFRKAHNATPRPDTFKTPGQTSPNPATLETLGSTREALLSEAGFEKVFRTQNWVRRSKLFCRWFCFLLGQAGCISVAA